MLSKFPKMVPDISYIWMAEVVRRITGSAKNRRTNVQQSAYLKGEMLSNFLKMASGIYFRLTTETTRNTTAFGGFEFFVIALPDQSLDVVFGFLPLFSKLGY